MQVVTDGGFGNNVLNNHFPLIAAHRAAVVIFSLSPTLEVHSHAALNCSLTGRRTTSARINRWSRRSVTDHRCGAVLLKDCRPARRLRLICLVALKNCGVLDPSAAISIGSDRRKSAAVREHPTQKFGNTVIAVLRRRAGGTTWHFSAPAQQTRMKACRGNLAEDDFQRASTGGVVFLLGDCTASRRRPCGGSLVMTGVQDDDTCCVCAGNKSRQQRQLRFQRSRMNRRKSKRDRCRPASLARSRQSARSGRGWGAGRDEVLPSCAEVTVAPAKPCFIPAPAANGRSWRLKTHSAHQLASAVHFFDDY